MKKLFIILIMVCFSGILLAQRDFNQQINARAGLTIGISENEIDSAVVNESTNTITLFNAGDTLATQLPASWTENVFTYVPKLYPDTVLVTTAEFRPTLTHVGKVIRLNRATQIKVFFPPDSTVNFPIGSTFYFKMDGAGICSFYNLRITRESVLDSMTLNKKGQWAFVIKRAAGKYDLGGQLTD